MRPRSLSTSPIWKSLNTGTASCNRSLQQPHRARKPLVMAPFAGGGRHGSRRRALRFKILSLGDECVGKSCLIKRFCDKRWVPSRIPTVGVDFGSKQVQDTGQQVLHLDFFDLAGAPEYAAVREDIYADAQGAVLVYDSSRPTTFHNLGLWLSEAAENGATGMFTMLVANKREGADQVDPEMACTVAKQHGLGFAEVDLPSGSDARTSGVEALFNDVISALLRNGNGPTL